MGGGAGDEFVPVDELYRRALRILGEKAPGYTIRQAYPDDMPAVQKINYRNLPENYPLYFFMDLYRRNPEAFYVAVAPSGEVVGYVMPRVEYKPMFTRRLLGKSGHIVSIAVEPEHRRRGLGYALMAHSLKSLKERYGCVESYLEVRVSNTPAISLYRKLGYVVVKRAHRYYLDGEDAYIMARPL